MSTSTYSFLCRSLLSSLSSYRRWPPTVSVLLPWLSYRRWPPTIAVLLPSLSFYHRCPPTIAVLLPSLASYCRWPVFARRLHTLELDRLQASSENLIEDLIFKGTSDINAKAHTFTRKRLTSASHLTFKLLVSGTVTCYACVGTITNKNTNKYRKKHRIFKLKIQRLQWQTTMQTIKAELITIKAIPLSLRWWVRMNIIMTCNCIFYFLYFFTSVSYRGNRF